MGDNLNFQNIHILTILNDSRKLKNLTLRDLAEKTNYSFQTLSKYENGLRDLNHENLATIAKTLDIPIETIYYIENDIENDLSNLIDSIFFDNLLEINTLINKIQTASQFIQYSIFQNKYRLIFFILNILDIYQDHDSYQFVNDHFTQFDNDLKQLYYEYKAIEYLKKNMLLDAVKTIDIANQFENRDYSAGMINYHASLIYTYHGKLHKALSFGETAEEYFIKTRNLNRLVNAQVHISTLEAKLGNFEKSKKMYLRILSTQIDAELKTVIHYNLSWLSFLNKNYAESLHYLALIEKDSNLTENGKFIKCANLYCLNRINEANKEYKSIIDTFTDPMFKLELEIIYLENTSGKDIESKLLELYDLTKNSRNFENQEFVIDRLIKFYEEQCKYKRATIFYKEKIELMNWMYSN